MCILMIKAIHCFVLRRETSCHAGDKFPVLCFVDCSRLLKEVSTVVGGRLCQAAKRIDAKDWRLESG